MPVISGTLTQFGLLKPVWLEKGRSVAIVAIFFVAAIITPPDIVSQIMVAFPMVLLYQVSIVICKILYKFKKKDEEMGHHLGNSASFLTLCTSSFFYWSKLIYSVGFRYAAK